MEKRLSKNTESGIIYVTDYLNPRVFGIAEALSAKGFDISVCDTLLCWFPHAELSSLSSVTALGNKKKTIFPFYKIKPLINMRNNSIRFILSFPKIIYSIIKIAKERKAKYIVAYTPAIHTGLPCLIASKLMSLTFVLDYAVLAYYGDTRHKFRTALEILVVKNADRIIVSNDVWKDQMTRLFGTHETKMCKVSYGVDPRPFEKQLAIDASYARKIYGILPDTRVILFTGSPRFIDTKFGRKDIVDIPTVIKSIPLLKEHIKNIKYIFLGISFYDEAKDLIERLNVKNDIIFAGGYVQADTKHLMTLRLADCLVLPACDCFTFKYFDRYKAYEYLMSQKPIVSVDLPAHREACQDAAIYYEPENAKDLAEKITRVLTDTELSQRMAKRGVPLIYEQHTWEKLSMRFLECMRE